MTSFDGAFQAIAAADFDPFVASIDLVTTFPTADGGTALNRATAGIDCQLDPNQIRLFGTLGGAGGISFTPGGVETAEFGRTRVFTEITFDLTVGSGFSLVALSRPSLNPEDEFKIKLARLDGGGDVIFLIDETSPPQPVDFSSVLEPGQYVIEYEAELTVGDDDLLREFGFEFVVPTPGVPGAAVALFALATARRRR